MKFLAPFFLLLFFLVELEAQDTIVFENKYPYLVFVDDESTDHIIYRKFDHPNGPSYILEKRFVTNVTYQDPASAKSRYRPVPYYFDKTLNVKITTMDSSGIVSGLMENLNDTTLSVKSTKKLLENTGGVKANLAYVFPYKNIYKIEVRRRDKVKKHLFWGTVGGFAAGTLTGLFIFKNDPVCEPGGVDGGPCDPSLASPRTKFEKSLTLGLGTAGAGLLAGGMIGSVRVTFIINGKKDSYNRTVPKLRRLNRLQLL